MWQSLKWPECICFQGAEGLTCWWPKKRGRKETREIGPRPHSPTIAATCSWLSPSAGVKVKWKRDSCWSLIHLTLVYRIVPSIQSPAGTITTTVRTSGKCLFYRDWVTFDNDDWQLQVPWAYHINSLLPKTRTGQGGLEGLICIMIGMSVDLIITWSGSQNIHPIVF